MHARISRYRPCDPHVVMFFTKHEPGAAPVRELNLRSEDGDITLVEVSRDAEAARRASSPEGELTLQSVEYYDAGLGVRYSDEAMARLRAYPREQIRQRLALALTERLEAHVPPDWPETALVLTIYEALGYTIGDAQFTAEEAVSVAVRSFVSSSPTTSPRRRTIRGHRAAIRTIRRSPSRGSSARTAGSASGSATARTLSLHSTRSLSMK